MRARHFALPLLAAALALIPFTSRAQSQRPAAAPTVDAFLAKHPLIKARLAWVTGDGGRLEYDAWSPQQKARIESFYAKLLANNPNLGMHLVDPEKASGYYTVDQAFDLFAAQVAHTLYLEDKNLVPWKIDDVSADELDSLLCSNTFFAMIKPGGNLPVGIEARRDFQEVPENEWIEEYLSDPRIGYDFLCGKTSTTGRSLIAKDPWSTVKNITLWMRDNVDHGPLDGNDGTRAKNLRWLDQRLRQYPGQKTAMANMGCHSAGKLFVDLARSVNIPILHVRTLDCADGNKKENYFSRTHASLVYDWAGQFPRVLWHVDEIYAREGRIFWPIDDAGKLLPQEKADDLYAETTWLTLPQLADAGFAYNLTRVYPNQGFGHDSPKDENRYDLGLTDGNWKGISKANLGDLFDWLQDYKLGGQPLVFLASHKVVQPQLQSNFKTYRGSLGSSQFPQTPSFKDFDSRANAVLTAIGGDNALDQQTKVREAARGRELLKPNVTYDHHSQ